MYTAKHIFTISDLTFYQCKMMFSCNIIDISMNFKITVLCREICNRLFFYVFFMYSHIILQITDCDKGQIVFFCHFPQLRCTHHGTVFFHDLTAHTAFFQSGHSHKIRRCLCVTVSYQNTAFSGNKRKYMSRSSEIFRFCLLVHTFSDRIRTLCCRDTGRCVCMIHCHRKCSSVIIGIFSNHRRKIQFCRNFRTHRCANQSFRISCHKINIFLRCKFCRTDQISLIFSVRIIGNQNDFSFP